MRFDPADNRVLRAKYMDWCSARVAERFLRLSPDQIYELAEQANGNVPKEKAAGSVAASEGVPAASGNGPAGSSPESSEERRSPAVEGANYWVRVARIADTFARELALPPFEDWRIAYLEAPERFDTELLGFWRDAVKG